MKKITGNIRIVFIFAIVAILAVAAPAAAETVLPGYTNIYVGVANDAGVMWNYAGNDTCLTNQNRSIGFNDARFIFRRF